jgi:hypothetical protein
MMPKPAKTEAAMITIVVVLKPVVAPPPVEGITVDVAPGDLSVETAVACGLDVCD